MLCDECSRCHGSLLTRCTNPRRVSSYQAHHYVNIKVDFRLWVFFRVDLVVASLHHRYSAHSRRDGDGTGYSAYGLPGLLVRASGGPFVPAVHPAALPGAVRRNRGVARLPHRWTEHLETPGEAIQVRVCRVWKSIYETKQVRGARGEPPWRGQLLLHFARARRRSSSTLDRSRVGRTLTTAANARLPDMRHVLLATRPPACAHPHPPGPRGPASPLHLARLRQTVLDDAAPAAPRGDARQGGGAERSRQSPFCPQRASGWRS